MWYIDRIWRMTSRYTLASIRLMAGDECSTDSSVISMQVVLLGLRINRLIFSPRQSGGWVTVGKNIGKFIISHTQFSSWGKYLWASKGCPQSNFPYMFVSYWTFWTKVSSSIKARTSYLCLIVVPIFTEVWGGTRHAHVDWHGMETVWPEYGILWCVW